MTIGNSIGFNIGMDNVSDKNAVKKYYPNANGLEYGYIDEDGSLVDDNNFARTSEFIEVNIPADFPPNFNASSFVNLYPGFVDANIETFIFTTSIYCILLLFF